MNTINQNGQVIMGHDAFTLIIHSCGTMSVLSCAMCDIAHPYPKDPIDVFDEYYEHLMCHIFQGGDYDLRSREKPMIQMNSEVPFFTSENAKSVVPCEVNYIEIFREDGRSMVLHSLDANQCYIASWITPRGDGPDRFYCVNSHGILGIDESSFGTLHSFEQAAHSTVQGEKTYYVHGKRCESKDEWDLKRAAQAASIKKGKVL